LLIRSAILLHQALPLDHAVLRDHAAGKFLEALLEDVLAAVGGEHLVVDSEAVERAQPALRNAALRRVLLEVADEGGEAAFGIALHGERRRGGCGDHRAGKSCCNDAKSHGPCS
jgi:hypothetical protein